jgi:hypothetical protein
LPAACEQIAEECPSLLEEVGIYEETGSNTSQPFTCGNGEVIDAEFECDGLDDCANGRDEQDC